MNMEENIKISNLNDFIFCPRSIYFHNLYYNYNKVVYSGSPQIKGTDAHKNIDLKKYSSRKTTLVAIDVYSEELGLVGKIDIFDLKTKTLIERKRKIVKIYSGYILQLHAQYYCLVEMGYEIKRLKFYSMVDNKSYYINLPSSIDKSNLKKIISKMRSFDLDDKFIPNINKCKMCIYRELCDVYSGD